MQKENPALNSSQQTPSKRVERTLFSLFVFVALLSLGIFISVVVLGVLATFGVIPQNLGSSHLAVNSAITTLLIYGFGWRLFTRRSLGFTLLAIGVGAVFMLAATYVSS
jgi:hypothetical protein